MPELIPFRWPVEWKDAARLDLLKGTPINCLTGAAAPAFPLGDLRFVPLSADQKPEGVALRDGVWPGVQAATKKEGSDAGPTGDAWVDSNAWVIRLARLMEPGQSVWVGHEPPTGNAALKPASFIKPVAEAEAFGGRWVMTLDKTFREGLEKGAAPALEAWQRMAAAHRFFAAHREWRAWQAAAVLGVISTFEGDGKMMSEEFLNLAPRRHLAYRGMLVKDAEKASFEGLKAIIYLEAEPPQGALRSRLLEFARSGGMLIGPSGIADAATGERSVEHTVSKLGSGRVAMPLQPWDDPFTLVAQVHVLLGHREDIVRVWNAGSTDSFAQLEPGGRKMVVHLIPYATERTQPITLGFSRKWRSARLLTLQAESAARIIPAPLGVEVAVGPITDYAAVLLES